MRRLSPPRFRTIDAPGGRSPKATPGSPRLSVWRIADGHAVPGSYFGCMASIEAPCERKPARRRRHPGGKSRETSTVAWIGPLLGLVGAIVAALIIAGKLPPTTPDPTGSIESPVEGSRVAREFAVSGALSHIREDEHVWIAVQVGNVLYPKEPEVAPADHFSEQIVEGGSPPGGWFSVVLLRVEPEGQSTIENWLSALRRDERPPGMRTIPGAQVLDAATNLRLDD